MNAGVDEGRPQEPRTEVVVVVVVGRALGAVTLGATDTFLTWTTTIPSLLLTLFHTISV